MRKYSRFDAIFAVSGVHLRIFEYNTSNNYVSSLGNSLVRNSNLDFRPISGIVSEDVRYRLKRPIRFSRLLHVTSK